MPVEERIANLRDAVENPQSRRLMHGEGGNYNDTEQYCTTSECMINIIVPLSNSYVILLLESWISGWKHEKKRGVQRPQNKRGVTRKAIQSGTFTGVQQ